MAPLRACSIWAMKHVSEPSAIAPRLVVALRAESASAVSRARAYALITDLEISLVEAVEARQESIGRATCRSEFGGPIGNAPGGADGLAVTPANRDTENSLCRDMIIRFCSQLPDLCIECGATISVAERPGGRRR